MTEIIAENPGSTSTTSASLDEWLAGGGSLQDWLAAEEQRMDAQAAKAHEPLFTSAQRARMGKWSLDKKLRQATTNLTKIQSQMRHGVARRAATPRLRRVVRAVRRDRRSPAAVRATADSGGDPDPDPEPPRPRPQSLYSLPASVVGGAL